MNNMTNEQEEQALKSERAYIDANVFIYSIINEDNVGEKARNTLEKIKNGEYLGFTATLTIDEILWALHKELDKDKTIEIAKGFINMQNLEFINVDLEIIKKSLENYHKSLKPRDSIHIASMQSKNIKTIISSDPDFDKIKEIKRIDFTK